MASPRLQRSVQEVQTQRIIGQGKRPRKRLPQQNIPRGIERDYARALVRISRTVKEELAQLLAELPDLVRSAQADRERLDVGESRRVRELIEQATERTSISTSAIETLAGQFAQQTGTQQRIQLGKQVRAGLGVDLFTPDTGLTAITESFVSENVSLIKDLPRKTLSEIEGVIQRGVSSGALQKDISAEITKRLAIGENRAKLIARDQVGKFYGNLNRVRQQAIGVEEFIWRTAGDERVRDEHVSLDGQKFKWSEGAPGEGLPGEPINCRCYAEPVLSEILAGV